MEARRGKERRKRKMRRDMTGSKNRLRPAVSQNVQTVHAPDISPLSQHNLRLPAEQHLLTITRT